VVVRVIKDALDKPDFSSELLQGFKKISQRMGVKK